MKKEDFDNMGYDTKCFLNITTQLYGEPKKETDTIDHMVHYASMLWLEHMKRKKMLTYSPQMTLKETKKGFTTSRTIKLTDYRVVQLAMSVGWPVTSE